MNLGLAFKYSKRFILLTDVKVKENIVFEKEEIDDNYSVNVSFSKI